MNRIDKRRRAFLLKGTDCICGFHCLVNWDIVCKTKEQSCLGVKNLSQMNQSLPAKWACNFSMHRPILGGLRLHGPIT